MAHPSAAPRSAQAKPEAGFQRRSSSNSELSSWMIHKLHCVCCKHAQAFANWSTPPARSPASLTNSPWRSLTGKPATPSAQRLDASCLMFNGPRPPAPNPWLALGSAALPPMPSQPTRPPGCSATSSAAKSTPTSNGKVTCPVLPSTPHWTLNASLPVSVRLPSQQASPVRQQTLSQAIDQLDTTMPLPPPPSPTKSISTLRCCPAHQSSSKPPLPNRWA